jgi:lysophospholipase L1-like esterase
LKKWLIGLGVLLVAGAIGFLLISRDRDDPSEPSPGPDAPVAAFTIVALGDSYISGEGALSFEAGTNRPGSNECRRARTAHPRLAADELGAKLTSIACSGARTHHILTTRQYPDSPPSIYGGRPQIEVLKELPAPDVVLLSIGGNDAGFAEIGASCAGPGVCTRKAKTWMERVDRDVYRALLTTYAAVKEAGRGAELLVLTYPNPLGKEWCGDVWLDRAEMDFLRDEFIPRLNTIVRTAAEATGVRVIDLEDSLDGARFCEVPLARGAMNFVTLSRAPGTPLDIASLIHGTFHPNPSGHALMAAKVTDALHRLRNGELGPRPATPASPPPLSPPPHVPEELRPAAPDRFPPRTKCKASGIGAVIPMSVPAGTTSVPLTGLKPRSRICYRRYAQNWRSRFANAAGEVKVPISVRDEGIASINEILVEQPDGVWARVVPSRL